MLQESIIIIIIIMGIALHTLIEGSLMTIIIYIIYNVIIIAGRKL